MSDMVLLPIVLLGVLSRDNTYATPIQVYADPVECIADLPYVSEAYLPEFPEAVFWCANPIGRVAAVDPLAATDLAMSDDLSGKRPKPRPDNLETDLDLE